MSVTRRQTNGTLDDPPSALPSAPIDAAARLRGRPGRVLLHSASGADDCGRWSFVACDPAMTVQARGRRVVVRDASEMIVADFCGDAIGVVEELSHAQLADAGNRDRDPAPRPYAIGYIGYDHARAFVPRLADPTAKAVPAGGELGAPDLWFGIYGAVWRHDRVTGSSDIVGTDARARERLSGWLSVPQSIGSPLRLGALEESMAHRAAYRAGFARLLEYIRAGDVYQVNLARRLSASIDADGDALALYAALAARFPEAYGALLELPGVRIVSNSPERFLSRQPGSRQLETRPIKGTRRRGADPATDLARAAELAADAKERAEHLMIVDLLRNDLGRLAEIGTVRVDGFARVVELPSLFHMVSTVSCRLRPDASAREIIEATFPGGSITGAPKLRAMQIIDELEPARRGVYTGAIGYLGARGELELSIAIRTAVITQTSASLHFGGGIVADSIYERELEETEEKAEAWRSVLAVG
jgi:para-aminobenzoate synthetase component 1